MNVVLWIDKETSVARLFTCCERSLMQALRECVCRVELDLTAARYI